MKKLALTVTLLALCAIGPVYAAEYTFATLDFPDADQTMPEDINDHGQVIGNWSKGVPGDPFRTFSPPQGFIWDRLSLRRSSFRAPQQPFPLELTIAVTSSALRQITRLFTTPKGTAAALHGTFSNFLLRQRRHLLQSASANTVRS